MGCKRKFKWSFSLCKSKNKQFTMVPFEWSSIKVYNFENLLYTLGQPHS